MSLKEFVKELNNKEKIEGELIKVILVSILTSAIFLSIVYFFKFRYIEDFIPKYGFYLFFAAIAYAFILPSIHYVRAYKEFPCMSGMMIGMTIGMVSGFLLGFFIGATNGMFWGSVFGMALGIFVGARLGACCGIMGVMEGLEGVGGLGNE